MKNLSFFLIPLTLVYMSCPPAVIYQQNTDSSGGTYREYPISIEIQGGDISKGVEVFEAEVSVYRMNNRTDTSLRLDKTYNLIIQEAYGERITRIDYTDDRSAENRSMISFGDTVLLFNPETEEVSQKININQPQNPAYRLLSSQNYLSKINLSLIRQEAKRIALDIQTDDAHTLTLALPPELAQLQHGDRRISSKVAFDVKDEVLASSETVTMTAGGAMVTVTVTPRYEKVDGIPVKIGQTTVTQVDIPQTLDVPYEGVIYNSPDDIPTISREEYESLRREGSIYEKAGLVFGNPLDLSYVETEVELYNTVKVNHAPVMTYKIPALIKVVVFFVSPLAAAVLIIADAIIDATVTSPVMPSPPPVTPSQPPVAPPVPNGYQGKEEKPVIEEIPTTEPELAGEILLARVESKTIKKTNDSGETEERSFYYFHGFDFDNYKASPLGITDIIQDEYEAIRRGGEYYNKDSGGKFNIVKPQGPYVIVGHSEGGLRALAYASYLKQYYPHEEEYRNLKGVITISGANKGFKALEGGIDVFKYNLYSFIDVIANGLNALDVLDIEPSFVYLYKGNFSSEAVTRYSLQNSVVRFLLTYLFPAPLKNYVVPVLSTNDYDSVAEIRDLVPFSTFANTYVADADVTIVKCVTETVERLKLFPFPHIVNEDVYGYYSLYSNETIQFDESLPVGYIIGTDSDTIGLIVDLEQRAFAEVAILALAACFWSAEDYYSAVNCASLGLANLFTDTLRSTQNARKAKEMFKDFNGAIHTRLLGSEAKANDGLLAHESMKYNSGKVVDKDNEGKRKFPVNHIEIKEIENEVGETTETWKMVYEYVGGMIKDEYNK